MWFGTQCIVFGVFCEFLILFPRLVGYIAHLILIISRMNRFLNKSKHSRDQKHWAVHTTGGLNEGRQSWVNNVAHFERSMNPFLSCSTVSIWRFEGTEAGFVLHCKKDKVDWLQCINANCKLQCERFSLETLNSFSQSACKDIYGVIKIYKYNHLLYSKNIL